EPGPDAVGPPRDDVVAPVAVDVAGLDRRVVRAIAAPRIVRQGQRRRGCLLVPAGGVAPEVDAVLAACEQIVPAVAVDVGEPDRLPAALVEVAVAVGEELDLHE